MTIRDSAPAGGLALGLAARADLSSRAALPGLGDASPFSPAEAERVTGLRDAIRALGEAVLDRRPVPLRAVEILNRAAAHPMPVPRLDPWSGRISHAAEDAFAAALAAVARDAIALFGSDLRGRIRRCGGAGCGTLFLDLSRSGRRRWCSMEVCGNRAKGARFRTRQKRAT